MNNYNLNLLCSSHEEIEGSFWSRLVIFECWYIKTVNSYSVEMYSKMITKTSQIQFKELQNFF